MPRKKQAELEAQPKKKRLTPKEKEAKRRAAIKQKWRTQTSCLGERYHNNLKLFAFIRGESLGSVAAFIIREYLESKEVSIQMKLKNLAVEKQIDFEKMKQAILTGESQYKGKGEVDLKKLEEYRTELQLKKEAELLDLERDYATTKNNK